MTVRVRFAPSPTGKLHVGNVRTALVNALVAKKEGGRFVIRVEDTDASREVKNSEQHIFDDLAWLGLEADESPFNEGDYAPYRTIDRANRGDYTKAVEKLMADGRAYECYVSKTELDLMRKIQTSQGQPPHYDNRHRQISAEDLAKFKEEGREPVIRFKLEEGEISWNDMVRGEVKFEAKNLGGDPIIVRSNGVPVFALAGAVDDIAQDITHVIRGEDHVTNTAIQVQIFEALGSKVPTMAHMPMLTDTDGGKLSKRLDSLSIKQLREDGYLPNAIITYLASLGFSNVPEIGNVEEVAQTFDISKMGRSSVRFDMIQLDRVNAQCLHASEWSEIKEHIAEFMPLEKDDQILSDFWNAIRGNVTTLKDVHEYYETVYGHIPRPDFDSEEDVAYIKLASENLPHGSFSVGTWGEWTGLLKEKSGRKGKSLFMPLRLALTGRSHGPDMSELLPILGEGLAKERLKYSIS